MIWSASGGRGRRRRLSGRCSRSGRGECPMVCVGRSPKRTKNQVLASILYKGYSIRDELASGFLCGHSRRGSRGGIPCQPAGAPQGQGTGAHQNAGKGKTQPAVSLFLASTGKTPGVSNTASGRQSAESSVWR